VSHPDCDLLELTAWVVSRFVARNCIAPSEVPALINSTHAAFARLIVTPESNGARTPAVPVEQPVHANYLICLQDGQRLKTLKGYISRKYSLSPAQYRARWNLPEDYPMVAPAYSQLRATTARRKNHSPGDSSEEPPTVDNSRGLR